MNIFFDGIRDGKIRNLEQLKRRYRALAKGIHPDTSGIDESGRLFAKLQGDFEEAKRAVMAGAPVPPPEPAPERAATPEDWRELFPQLMASGFPVEAGAKVPAAYRRRVESFGRAIEAKGIRGVDSFAEVERDLAELRGGGSIPPAAFASVRMLLYGLASNMNYPTRFARDAVLRQYGELSGALREDGLFSLDAFIGWMIGEME